MIAVVVLAAGAATRFGAPKQRLLVEHVLERVRASSVDEIVVVTGAYELETTAPVVHCPDWELGPGASLRCGLSALPDGAEAAIVILADGPDLAPASIDRLIDAWRSGAGEVLAASYGGARGHPVLLARAVWDSVPDEGARALTPVLVPCDDLGSPGDVDYPDDLPEGLRAGPVAFGIRLTVVGSQGEADVLCSLLRSFGIQCSDRATGSPASIERRGGWGGRREILVREADLASARELLASRESEA